MSTCKAVLINTKKIVTIEIMRNVERVIIADEIANPKNPNPAAILSITSIPTLTPKTIKTSEISQIISHPTKNDITDIPSFTRVGMTYFFFLPQLDLQHNNIIIPKPVKLKTLIGNHPCIRLIDSSDFIILTFQVLIYFKIHT